MLHPKRITWRIFVCCLALSFLPVLLSVSTAWEPEPSRAVSASHPELRVPSQLLEGGAFLPVRMGRLHRPHNGRRPGSLRHFPLYFRALPDRPSFRCAAAVRLLPHSTALCLCRTCIIRYIHDQDGEKDGASVF